MSPGYNDILRGIKDIEYYAALGEQGEYAILGGTSVLFRLYHVWNRSYVNDAGTIRKLRRIPDLAIILTSEAL